MSGASLSLAYRHLETHGVYSGTETAVREIVVRNLSNVPSQLSDRYACVDGTQPYSNPRYAPVRMGRTPRTFWWAVTLLGHRGSAVFVLMFPVESVFTGAPLTLGQWSDWKFGPVLSFRCREELGSLMFSASVWVLGENLNSSFPT